MKISISLQGKLLIIIVFAIFVFTDSLNAQYVAPSVYSSRATKLNEISIGDTLSFSDPDFGKATWANIDTHLFVNHTLALRINYDNIYTLSDSIVVRLMTRTYYLDSDSVSHDFRDTLYARYNPHNPSEPQFIDARVNRQGFHHADVIIEDIQVITTLGAWALQAVSISQIYQISLIELIQVLYCLEKPKAFHSTSNTYWNIIKDSIQYKGLNINWTPIQAANHYEFEWTFLDSLSYEHSHLRDSSTTSYDFDLLFRNNASRIITTELKYRLFPVYGEGFILYRARAVFINSQGKVSYSAWSTSHSQNSSGGSSALGRFKNDFRIKRGHQPDMNWSYSAVFAEEGKTARSIEYFDGTLRSRQSQSFLNTEKESIIGEGVYDQMGRRTMEIIPTPSNRGYLAFDPLYNRFEGDLINPSDVIPQSCTDPSFGLDQMYGSAAYYSENNPDITVGLNSFIPHAEGFVYSLNSFLPDNTGRVRESASPGEMFSFGAGHTTRYMYATPTAEELFSFFGNEAGNPNSYKKNAVVDPNGQISVSILNDKDQVVLTGLAGDPPDQLQTLASVIPVTDVNISLLNNNSRNGNSMVSYHNLLITKAGDVTINYSINPEEFQLDCMPTDICFDCAYDLTIKISDQCGNEFNNGEPFIHSISNFSFGSLDYTCNNNSSIIAYTDTIESLPIGQYVVEKTLTINEFALNAYADSIMNIQTCLPPIEEFISAAEAAQTFTSCNLDCQSCLDAIGDEQDFIDDYVNQLEVGNSTLTEQERLNEAHQVYDGLIESCNVLCNPEYQNPCQSLYESLLADITPPYGQYAKAEINETSGLYEAIILNDGRYRYNILDHSFKTESNALSNYTNSSIIYLNEDGNPETGVYDFEGVLRAPKNLNVNDFILNFKESWAEELTMRLF
jgi:hypothetical protein